MGYFLVLIKVFCVDFSEAVETIIRIKLREVMMMVNLDEVTSKFVSSC